jgi:hypothetical protein
VSFPISVSPTSGLTISQPLVQVGANRYMVTFDAANLHMMTAPIGGLTWAELDPSHAPAFSSTFLYSICQDGTNVWIAYNNTADNAVRVAQFNTVTGLWVGSTLTTNAGPLSPVVVYRAATNTLAIVSQVTAFAVGGVARCGYFIFNCSTLTYGAWIKCGSTGASVYAWAPFAVTVGNGMVHFFLNSINPVGSDTVTVYQQPLSDAGVLGSIQTIDSAANVGAAVTNDFMAASDGTTVAVIWTPFAGASPDFTLSVVWQGLSAAVIAFVSQNLYSPATTFISDVSIARSSTVGTYAFLNWQDSTFTNSYFGYALDPGSGFGALQTFGVDPTNTLNLFGSTVLTNGGGWGVAIGVSLESYYWEPAAGPGPGPLTMNPPQIRIIPFPKSTRDACCPQLVTVAQPGGVSGKLYVTSKAPPGGGR